MPSPFSALLVMLVGLPACALFGQTIPVVLPAKYAGWLFVVPGRDTSHFPVRTVAGSYRATTAGVAYVPDALIRGTFRVLLYQKGRDVAPEAKYAALYEGNVAGSTGTYRFVQFYLATGKEKNLPAAAEYWRGARAAKGEQEEQARLQQLLKSRQLYFH